MQLTTTTSTLSNLAKESPLLMELRRNPTGVAAKLHKANPDLFKDPVKLASAIKAHPEEVEKAIVAFRKSLVPQAIPKFFSTTAAAKALNYPETSFRRILRELQLRPDATLDGAPAFSHAWISRFNKSRWMLTMAKEHDKRGNEKLASAKLQDFFEAMNPAPKPPKLKKLSEIL